ncbi:50S ribosomal protein L25 [Providencia stuartii]|uniref:Large ribosomal subunit protein bL25 n=2 Tax=Providencia TaxID=586 RepID=A0A1S1HQL8_PROST|nr:MULTISPECIES: 50S ribosomal protein L25 [Providencia]MDV5224720.1 50S ribosomal protein L25 [Providencia rettgeri]ELR5041946.1 50S ribosomal protein L25 [Providencia stuartii]ELR5080793.1 50S ribosomal protein L25 [Providencia stuartii]ELR5111555.1 50S ribosomal protein L25 [Providencia stuartii]ELR5302109.1 50S ribosomal protein L25 [Providencia stuartii]
MLTINAIARTEQGKGASRRLRRANQFPAIVYGGNQEPISVTLNHDEVINQEGKAEFYEVLNLVIDGKETKVKVQAVQRHPFKPKVTHIDFLRV